MRRNTDTDRGATAIEYALLIALVGVVVIVGVTFVGSRLSSTFASASGPLTGAGAQGALAEDATEPDDEAEEEVTEEASEAAEEQAEADARAAQEQAEADAQAAQEQAEADARAEEEAKEAELRAAEEKAAEEEQAGLSDEEREKQAEEAKRQAEEDAKAAEEVKDGDDEGDGKVKGPKPVFTKGSWTCPNKWTYDKGECIKL
jgi:Flp pilus assembly pilin Flp